MNSSSEESIGLSTTPSTMLPPSTYVSCIKINGRPILPPLMTEAKRIEMQRYKELAVALETRLLERKKKHSSVPYQKSDAVHHEQDLINLNLNPGQEHDLELQNITEPPKSITVTDNGNVMQPQAGFDQHFVTRKPFNIPSENASVPSEEATPKGDEDKENENISGDESGSGSSSDVFASVGSSTDTFIIKEGAHAAEMAGDNKSQTVDDDGNDLARSEGEVPSSSDKENEIAADKGDEREDLILSCKRKRPAFYFDEADDDEETESDVESQVTADTTYECSEQSKGTSSSISLNPFLPPDVTWSSVSGASYSFAGTDADNSGRDILLHSPRTPEQSQSFEGGENSDTVKQNRQQQQQNLFTPRSQSRGTSNSSYDVTLSTKIPSSAENTPAKKVAEDKTESRKKDGPESDSDKENQDTSKSPNASSHKKHVRKLSYTLDQPSDALLASGMTATDTQAQDANASEFGVIPFPLSTIPSSNLTPVKFSDYNAKIMTMPTPSAEELDNRLEALDRHLQQLQVGVELNKKKHLERYMDDVADSNSASLDQDQPQIQTAHSVGRVSVESSPRRSTPIKDFQKEIEQKFNELQTQQQKQLEYLMKVHREQEHKLKEDFDRQRAFLLEQLKAAPTAHPKSLPTTPRNFQHNAATASVKSFTSIRNSTNPFITTTSTAPVLHSPAPAAAQERSTTAPPGSPPDPRSGLTSAGAASTTTASDWATDNNETETRSVISTSTTNTLTEIGSVGLSKLQAKMRALSPKYRKMGGEARSPLLKGVAFPNPLNRSYAPVRIPPKALEPDMAPKYARVSACVRGYLTRRLLHTDKIQTIIQTIRDTVDFVMRLYEENPIDPAHLQIKPEEINLHRMLIQQLNGACSSFHGIFFKLTTPERMAIIATDRQKLKAKALKEQLSYSNAPDSGSSKHKRNVSTATLKAIERRLSFASNTQQQMSKTPVYYPPRKVPGQSSSSNNMIGSKSVNPKPFAKSRLGISPSTKRRRFSHYVFKLPKNVSATIDTGLSKSAKRLSKAQISSTIATPKFTTRPSATTDQNGNNWKPRASCAATMQQHGEGSGPVHQQHNVIYTMKTPAVAGAGFQANPARIETNFSGAEIKSQDIFNNLMNLMTTAPANLIARPKSQVEASTNANTSTSTSTSASSRFSIGSNHSHSGYHYSSTSTRASTTAAGRGLSRKSVGRPTKPWK